MSDVTRLLNAISQGDSSSKDLLPLVYDELRQLAARKLSHEKPGQTLQPTALVHEAYARLVGSSDESWENQRHFFGAAAEAMRRILIENARRKQSFRRGGALQQVSLDNVQVSVGESSDELLALDEALTRLEEVDATKAELVKLRYFAGLTIPQAAQALCISVTTANRYWSYARAWLYEELADGDEP